VVNDEFASAWGLRAALRSIPRSWEGEWDKAFGSRAVRGEGAERPSQEAEEVASAVVEALVEGEVEAPRADAAEGPEVVSQSEPEAIDRVGVDFTNAVPVVVARPLLGTFAGNSPCAGSPIPLPPGTGA